MNKDVEKIVNEMTLEEKAGLCSGLDFWRTKGVERLDIQPITLTDGPHGLRKQSGESDHLGLSSSVPSTCFPSGAALACSWDRNLGKAMGKALGDECLAEGVSILLGPAANIKRSPLCGRNFEYFSEDPYLSTEMAASHIEGVQSRGIGTSIKHYAANNQEYKRMTIDAVVDERSLREIYLASFEGAIKKSRPWTVMCAYNKVNGEYCSENKYLLTDILKNEWGHKGFVVSDWGAVNDRVHGLSAGLELEMPGSSGEGDKKIMEAIKTGKIAESVLDDAVKRLLRIIFKAIENKKDNASYKKDEHHKLARKIAAESMVLLKNEDNILPVDRKSKLAVIGSFAKKPRYQGGGSSHINPTAIDDAYEEIKKSAGENAQIVYAQGYLSDDEAGMFSSKRLQSKSDTPDEKLISEAVKAATESDIAVVFVGLPESYESEGYDRADLGIPKGHVKLIEEVSKAQKNTIVVLSNGSPVEMPWLDGVKGVIETYLSGQAFGGAISDVLFGDNNPSGKLAETFPKKLSDNPSYLNFPGDEEKVEYREGIFVGYRYYEAKEVEPLFPFGYGLSYTDFEYVDIFTDKTSMDDTDTLEISVKVKNTGLHPGKEVVQLYVRDIKSQAIRPVKELKGFEKIQLAPGEEKTVTFDLGKRAFAYYNESIRDWHVESGEFEILVGGSSADTPLKLKVTIESTVEIKKKFTVNSTLKEVMSHPQGVQFLMNIQKATEENGASSMLAGGADTSGMSDIISSMPLRSIMMFGAVPEEVIEDLIKKLNGE